MTVENFVQIEWRVLQKIEKVENWLFFGHFWANFDKPYNVDAIAQIVL